MARSVVCVLGPRATLVEWWSFSHERRRHGGRTGCVLSGLLRPAAPLYLLAAVLNMCRLPMLSRSRAGWLRCRHLTLRSPMLTKSHRLSSRGTEPFSLSRGLNADDLHSDRFKHLVIVLLRWTPLRVTPNSRDGTGTFSCAHFRVLPWHYYMWQQCLALVLSQGILMMSKSVRVLRILEF